MRTLKNSKVCFVFVSLSVLILFFLMFVSTASATESPDEGWSETYEGKRISEFLTSVQQTTDGGRIIAGSSDGGYIIARNVALPKSIDYWVVKLEGTEKANSNLLPLNSVMAVFMFAIAFLVFKNRKD